MVPITPFLIPRPPILYTDGVEEQLDQLTLKDMTLQRLTAFLDASNLWELFEEEDIVQITRCIADARKVVPFCPAIVKKDGKNLALSLIIDETASYILLKTHRGTDRHLGSQKLATDAIRVPVNENEPVLHVCQLVNLDSVQNEVLENFDEEFALQKQFAALGISPQVYATHNYIKSKDGENIAKKTAFVEPFDTDLQAFDPMSSVPSEFPPLTHETIFNLAQTLADYIATLHAKDIIHGDLCLENVGTFADLKRFLLTDFGHTHSSKIIILERYGHLWSTAPELFENKATNSKACDIYAFAILLSHLIVDPDAEIEDDEPAWVDTLAALYSKSKKEQKPYKDYPEDIAEAIALQKQFSPFAEAAKSSIGKAKDVYTFLKAFINICLHPEPEQRPTAQELVYKCKQFKETLPA